MKTKLLVAILGFVSIQQIQSSSNLPTGSYLQSCDQCSMNNSILTATCNTGETIVDYASNSVTYLMKDNRMNVSECLPETIENKHGQLCCITADGQEYYGTTFGTQYNEIFY